MLRSYFAGLRKIFTGWQPPAAGSMADIEDHYKKLTRRFGYPILVPEYMMNQAGHQLLATNRISEATAVFERNAELYPYSSNCLDSLAEALEKDGQTKKAIENYEKAYKMAELRGETELARSARSNFERLSRKFK